MRLAIGPAASTVTLTVGGQGRTFYFAAQPNALSQCFYTLGWGRRVPWVEAGSNGGRINEIISNRMNEPSQPLHPEEVALLQAQLERMVASPVFRQSERLCRFLRFVVEARLAGNAEMLKEALIGVEVYDRSPGYNPKVEPIVRNEARRLRAKIGEYYESAPGDRVVIDLPKGGYVPSFVIREAREEEKKEAGVPVAEVAVPAGRWMAPVWMGAGAAVVAGLLVVLLLGKGRTGGALEPPARLNPLTSFDGFEFQANLSPDGSRFVFVKSGPTGKGDLFVGMRAIGETTQLTADGGQNVCPAFSPDGRWIAFLRLWPKERAVYVMPSGGGKERRIREIAPRGVDWIQEGSSVRYCPGPAWFPDGKAVAVSDRTSDDRTNAIFRIPLGDGAATQVTYPEPGTPGDSQPVVGPEGDRVIAVRAASERGITDLILQSVASRKEVRKLTNDHAAIEGVCWCKGDRIVFSSNRTGSPMLWETSVHGSAPVALEGVGRGVAQPTCPRDVFEVAFTETFRNTNIWEVDVGSNGRPRRLIASSRKNESMDLSPDGGRLVFISDRSGTREIWTGKADGSQLKQLTAYGGIAVGTPRWSPDGRRIVYDTVNQGRSAIAVMNGDGSGRRIVVAGESDHMMPSWSRDGSGIYFATRVEGRLQVARHTLATGVTVQLTRTLGGEAAESVDGKTVYFEHGTAGIWQVPVEGGKERAVPGLESVPHARHWKVMGEGIYYLSSASPPWTIAFYRFASGRSQAVFRMESTPVFRSPSLTVTADGRRLIYAQQDHSGSDILIRSARP